MVKVVDKFLDQALVLRIRKFHMGYHRLDPKRSCRIVVRIWCVKLFLLETGSGIPGDKLRGIVVVVRVLL